MPLPTSLVVKNGSNARACTSGGIPGPVSPISTTSTSASVRVEIRRVPFPSMASTALSIRFVQTWLSSPGIASMRGTSAP